MKLCCATYLTFTFSFNVPKSKMGSIIMANEESLFLFCGRRTDRIKALYWTGDGYVFLYKRLSNGGFQWPRSEAELKLLNPQSFRWLREGLHIEQKTAIRKGKPKDLF